MLDQNTQRVLNIALPDTDAFNEVSGALGISGGFQVNSDASVATVTGGFIVLAQSGIETGSYQVKFPAAVQSRMTGINAFTVSGFTPRAAQTAETCEARVTGYNRDSSGNWYISVQIATISTGAINPTPPAGFVVGLIVQPQYSGLLG
jgi:hypothetical protein